MAVVAAGGTTGVAVTGAAGGGGFTIINCCGTGSADGCSGVCTGVTAVVPGCVASCAPAGKQEKMDSSRKKVNKAPEINFIKLINDKTP